MAKRAPGTEAGGEAPGAELQKLFGENFRAARIRAGLSQTDVAAISGIAQQSISQIEAGQHNLTLKTMDKLARVVSRDVTQLLRAKRSKTTSVLPKTSR
jgi:transcriptional regulator with XRE-family HTH domain